MPERFMRSPERPVGGSARTKTCQDHCTGCGRHFSSLAAFDAHRAAGPPFRRCIDPGGNSRFVCLSDRGECRMYAEVQVGVAVWTLSASLEAARGAWRAAA